MAYNTTLMSTGGAYSNPLAADLPEPDGVSEYGELWHGSWPSAKRNLVDPDAPSEVYGSPTIQAYAPAVGPTPAAPGCAKFSGVQTDYLLSGVAETATMAVLFLVQIPVALAAGEFARLCGAGGGTGVDGFSLYIRDANHVLELRNQYVGESSDETSGQIVGAVTPGEWAIIAAVMEEGVGRRCAVVSDNRWTSVAKTTARRHDGQRFRIGTRRGAPSATAKPIWIAARMTWSDYAPSTAELRANAKYMAAGAAQFGVNVTVLEG